MWGLELCCLLLYCNKDPNSWDDSEKKIHGTSGGSLPVMPWGRLQY